MKILAHDKGKGVDSYGKGEHRWNVNWLDFLEKEGHDVRKGRSNTRQSFDFYMDAPDICQTLAGRHQKHMHLNFSGCSLDLLNWPCYKNGELYVALPYRRGYERALKFWKDDNVVQPLFMPTCYPDYLLPKDRRPSWERPNITAALKDPFCKAYTDSRPAVADNVIWCLRAISKLADTEDFVFNIIQHNDMCIGHKDYTEEAGRIIVKDLFLLPSVFVGGGAFGAAQKILSRGKITSKLFKIVGGVLGITFVGVTTFSITKAPTKKRN